MLQMDHGGQQDQKNDGDLKVPDMSEITSQLTHTASHSLVRVVLCLTVRHADVNLIGGTWESSNIPEKSEKMETGSCLKKRGFSSMSLSPFSRSFQV